MRIRNTIQRQKEIGIECIEKYPDMMVNKCLEKYPELVCEMIFKNILDYLKMGTLKSSFFEGLKECLTDGEINRKIVELLFEINGSKKSIDLIIKKLLHEVKNNDFLFCKLFYGMNGYFPQFYSKLSETVPNLAKSVLMEIGTLPGIFLGGIGKAEYNEISHKLVVQGYYLPAENFDEIVVYSQEKELGHAELGIKRPDVYKKVPNYHNICSGWRFSTTVDAQINEIKIIVKRNHEVLKKEIKAVDICSSELEKLQYPYMIDRSSLHDLSRLQIERIDNFNRINKQLKEYFDWGRKENLQKFFAEKEEIIYGSRKVEELFLDIFCEDDNKIICFSDAQIEFQDFGSLWTIVDELLVQEKYFFESDKECPFIIDGDSNIGLAIYYFKRKFPKSRITAFEPSKETFDIAKRNVERNGWKEVELLPFSFDEKENPIISEVDFLKLTIEKMGIIRKLHDKLKLIKYIFLEVHYRKQMEDDGLMDILEVLKTCGFHYQVVKSTEDNVNVSCQLMKYADAKYSLIIWAERKI